MNKHIVNALSKYNFEFDKNHGYGFINDYEVNVFNDSFAHGPVFMFSTYLLNSQRNEFIEKMKSYKFHLVQTQVFDWGVMIMIGSLTAKSFEKKLEKALPKILEALESINAPKKDVCPQSGEKIDETNSQTIIIPDTNAKITLSNNAIASLNDSVKQENENFKNAPNNYLKGFCGVLIGAAAGLAATIILALLGYISAVSSLLSICLGTFLYKKFGGKANYVMIIMSFITTLIIILGGLTIIYSMTAENELINAGVTDYKSFAALAYCLANVEEFKRAFIADIGLNLVFILIAEGCTIFSLIKSIKRPKGIETK